MLQIECKDLGHGSQLVGVLFTCVWGKGAVAVMERNKMVLIHFFKKFYFIHMCIQCLGHFLNK
jgi:hypothetical protein